MVKLNPDNLKKFIELLQEEHTIKNNTIQTIYDILIEATGYVEEEVIEKPRLTKKEMDILRSKKRVAKENENCFNK
tara:strand:+ start:448 stop:675 length:228 start_codon:yes stop_codon:yes gene_type:complete